MHTSRPHWEKRPREGTDRKNPFLLSCHHLFCIRSIQLYQSLHSAILLFYPPIRVPRPAPGLKNGICCTQFVEYFRGGPIHGYVHILVDPVTRSQGRKSTSGVCASVDGDDHPWMKGRPHIVMG